jgi:L-ascorbate metabolism protein UlaG (beta-lactamase superfamily)
MTEPLDVAELVPLAIDFRKKLETAKQAVGAAFEWYPYDTLGNIWHFDALLTEGRRDLLALAEGGPVLDIGCADGDLAFFIESLGIPVVAIDHPRSSHNGMAGVHAAKRALHSNVEIRTVDEGRKEKPEEMFFGHDVDVGNDPVRVFADDKVVVTAVTNTHYPERFVARMQHRSLGYRFETSTRSICFSGDTAYSANVVKLARGADVFVCEVMDHRTWENNMARAREQAAAGNPESVARHVAETHSTPGDVGRMAKEAGVKTVVLNHQLRGQAAQGWTIAAFIDGVRAEFDGNVIVGEDQLVI